METSLFRLDRRRALVTGATGGLGGRFVRVLHGAGASIVMTGRDVNHPQLLRLQEELEARRPGSVRCHPLDVRERESIDALFNTLADEGIDIDVLINNAGIATGTAALTLSDEDWNAVIDTNLRGPWMLAQRFARARVASPSRSSRDTVAGEDDKTVPDPKSGASIVNVGSILGSRVSGGTAAYAAAKAGLVHLTRSLALEWARYGIRVNSLSPGYVLTDINRDFFQTEAGAATIKRVPQRRIGAASDLDGALLLLASDASSYMSGSDLVVDGGHLCSAL